MFVATLCLLMAVGALAQVPATCPGPEQFEGRFQRRDRERGAQVSGFFAYDRTMRRVRELEDIDTKGTRSAYDVLRLYELNVEYRVDLTTKKCNVTQPRFPFRPLGVPPEAEFVREGVIGAAGVPGEEVTVAEFAGSFEGNNYTVVVTYPDCFPVRQSFYSKDGIEMSAFYDLQSGISDPELFFPPKECSYDKERKFAVRGAMIYDGPNKRIREVEDETFNSTRVVYDKLKLYNENKEYIIDVKTRKCNVTTPRHGFHPYGVPPGGKFMAEAVIGVAGVVGESVTVADFAEKSNSSGFFSVVTEPDCFPVHDAFFSEDGLEVVNFYDLTSGISDPNAFLVPKECMGL